MERIRGYAATHAADSDSACLRTVGRFFLLVWRILGAIEQRLRDVLAGGPGTGLPYQQDEQFTLFAPTRPPPNLNAESVPDAVAGAFARVSWRQQKPLDSHHQYEGVCP